MSAPHPPATLTSNAATCHAHRLHIYIHIDEILFHTYITIRLLNGAAQERVENAPTEERHVRLRVGQGAVLAQQMRGRGDKNATVEPIGLLRTRRDRELPLAAVERDAGWAPTQMLVGEKVEQMLRGV